MPIHNGGRWLRETLAGAAAQDCTGIEFLLFDSSDGDECERIAAEFRSVLDLHYDRRRDLKPWTAKTNLAARRARAPHFSMLHQDDLWLPGRVEDMRAAIAADPAAVLQLNPSYIVDQASRRLGLWRCPLPAVGDVPPAALAERLLVQNFVAVPAPIIRRDAWLAAGGMDDSLWYTADWDLYLKVARQGSTRYRRSATTAFRVHGSSLTVTGSADIHDFSTQMLAVVDRHIDLIPEGTRRSVRRMALTSVQVNAALARVLAGGFELVPTALVGLARLGPSGIWRYLRYSRLRERVWPRVRARVGLTA